MFDGVIRGLVIKLGDDINTDVISPPQYMELSIDEAARHTLEAVVSGFADRAGPNAIIGAGRNFGSGSSRETTPLALRHLGMRVIVAKSFARIFYRNSINVGLAPLECPQADSFSDGDEIAIDLRNGKIENAASGLYCNCDRIPEHIMRLIEQGGLVASLKKRLGAG